MKKYKTIDDTQTQKNMAISIKDGMAYSVGVGFAESFFSPFGIFCGLSAQQIGTMVSLPHLIGNTLQLYTSNRFKSSNKRQRWIVFGAFLQAVVLLPLAASLLFWNSLPYLIILFSLIFYFSTGNSIGPLWSSMMGDIVPENQRGRYFGRRNMIIGMVLCFSMTIAGIWLYICKKFNFEEIGYAISFFIGFAARLISSWYLSKMIDPMRLSQENNKKKELNFLNFFKDLEKKNCINFILFFAFMNFSVSLAGPYFPVYMLKELHFNYIEFTVSSLAVLIFMYLSMPLWGKFSDKIGNKKIIIFSGICVILTPILWLFDDSIYWIIFVQSFSGVGWAGLTLSASNYIFDTLNSEDRILGFSLSQFFNGYAIFTGAFIGGILVNFFEQTNLYWSIILKKILGGYNLKPIFLISGIARFTIFILFYKSFQEIRIKSTYYHNPLSVLYRFIKIRFI